MSQNRALARFFHVNAALCGERVEVESLFQAHYVRLARAIARVVRDPARAEELAVEVFLKWSRHPEAHGAQATAWLFRTAVRMGLDELRRSERRGRIERFFGPSPPETPEEIREEADQRRHVRTVLAALDSRQAEILLLRADGLSYEETAAALGVSAASVGTLLSRARQSFRKEYVKRYGER